VQIATEVRDLVRQFVRALDRGRIDAVLDHRSERRIPEDRLADRGVRPGRDVPIADTTAQAVHEQRAVVTAAEIVLSGPHQLDGTPRPDRLRDLSEFGREMRVLLRPPPEAPARQHGLDLDPIGREPENARDGHVVNGLHLAAEACQGAVDVPAQEAIERLHRRMREIRKYELRLDDALRPRERRLGITMSLRHHARPTGKRAILGDKLFAAAALGRGIVPRDAQRFAPLTRRPVALRVHRNAGRHLPDVDHSRHSTGGRCIERRDLAAEPRWMGDQHGEHSRLAYVDCVLRGSVGLGCTVEPTDALLTNQPERRRVLELRVGRNRQARRRFGEFAKPALTPGRMTQHAAFPP